MSVRSHSPARTYLRICNFLMPIAFVWATGILDIVPTMIGSRVPGIAARAPAPPASPPTAPETVTRRDGAGARATGAGGRTAAAAARDPAPATAIEHRPQPTDPAQPGDPAASRPGLVASGRRVIPGTYMWDVDRDALGAGAGADLWWRHHSTAERALAPRGGAAIARVEDADYDALEPEALAGLAFTERAVADADAGRALAPGTVLAVVTGEGNVAKIRIAGYRDARDLEFEGGARIPQAERRFLRRSKPSPHHHVELDWALYRLADAPPAPVPLAWSEYLAAGDDAYERKDYDEAARLFAAAVDTARADDLPGAAALGLVRGHSVHRRRGDVEEAERMMLEAGALVEAIGDDEAARGVRVRADLVRHDVVRAIGAFYAETGRHAEAVAWYERALALLDDRPGVDTGKARLYATLRLADALARLGRAADARAALDDARALAGESARRPSGIASQIERIERRLADAEGMIRC